MRRGVLYMECYGGAVPACAGHWAPYRMLGASVRSRRDGKTRYVNVRICGTRRMHAMVEVLEPGSPLACKPVRTGAGEADVLRVVNSALGSRYRSIEACVRQ